MTDSAGLTAQLENIVSEHSLLFPDGDVDHGECAYGDWTGHWQDHPAHVAAVITEHLELKQEWTRRWDNSSGVEYGRPKDHPTLIPPLSSGVELVSRWVSSWKPTQ